MKTSFVIFDGMTALDFVGVYDPLTRLRSMSIMPEFEWDICSLRGDVLVDRGLRFIPDVVAAPLGGYGLVVVPGGFGTRPLLQDGTFLEWLRTAAPAKIKASVCSGSLLLGAAGFLEGKRATTHPRAHEELAPYCSRIVDERVVDEGDVVTARGVTAAIDLGLHLVARIAGREARTAIARQMDYRMR